MTLAADEFIRRFLLHVLPRGFHRIRHYGLLTGSARKTSLERARALLAVAPPANADMPAEPPDTRPPCPCCGGHMVIVRPAWLCSETAMPCQATSISPPAAPTPASAESRFPHRPSPADRGFLHERISYTCGARYPSQSRPFNLCAYDPESGRCREHSRNLLLINHIRLCRQQDAAGA